MKRVQVETSHFQHYIERVMRLSVHYATYTVPVKSLKSGLQLMQGYKLTVRKRIKWMMNMRIMIAVLMMKTVCLMAGSMMIISLELAAEVKSITQIQKHLMKIICRENHNNKCV